MKLFRIITLQIVAMFLSAITTTSFGQTKVLNDSVLIFAYFKNNGEDGLHLAYSKDGYHFAALHKDSSLLIPAVSKDKLMRDPCVIKGADGLYHMVWTVSWSDKGIGYASSKDLVHWSSQQYLPVMQHEQNALNCWAPEITFDPATGLYIIYWATTITGRFTEGAGDGDDKYNHRIYYTSTKDFLTYSPTKLLYNAGFNVIDATIQQDGNRYIMFLKDETLKPVPQKNIRIAVSDAVDKSYGKLSAPITGKYWAEGPGAVKLGDKWIVYFDKYMEHSYGAVSSTDGKTWTDISGKISFPKGTRHGTVLKISGAEFRELSAALQE